MKQAISRDAFRKWVSTYIQTITFLGAYFLLVVFGNIIFASPWGRASLEVTNYRADFLDFPHVFTTGYWALLLVPFLLTPIIVWATRKATVNPVAYTVSLLPDFRLLEFIVVALLIYAYLLATFIEADVWGLFSSGNSEVSSVQARYEIRERIGFSSFVLLQAALPFLTVFAAVQALRMRSFIWGVLAVTNIALLSVLLIMINMKWPILLLYLAVVAAIFVYAPRWSYVATIAGVIAVVVTYLVVSVFVFRFAAATAPLANVDTILVSSVEQTAPASAPPTLLQMAFKFAPSLAAHALNRMAISYPYYYQTFTEQGAVCGGVLVQMMPGPACRPSTYIYEVIFGQDGFEGRGTSPMPVHVSSYAYGGWPVAILGLVSASVILGLFAALPLDKSAMAGALAVTGAVNGYHLSQIPGEGIFLYEHGLLWLGLMLGIYVAVHFGVGIALNGINSSA